MKINLKFDFKKIIPIILNRFSLVLWLILLLVALAESYVISASVAKINRANEQGEIDSAQLVRINFSAYDTIEKRLNHNQEFVPQEPTSSDPFGLPPSK